MVHYFKDMKNISESAGNGGRGEGEAISVAFFTAIVRIAVESSVSLCVSDLSNTFKSI